MNENTTQPPAQSLQNGLEPALNYLPFVRKVVTRIARRLPAHVRIEDLMSAGVVGLLEAMRRYDPAQVTDFEVFAEFRVKGALLDELRRRDLMARDARLAAKQIEQAIASLAQVLGREPDEDEMAAHLHLSVEELRQRLERFAPVQVLSIEELGEAVMASGIEDPFDATARREVLDALAGAIERLNERHRLALHLYYREDLTLREIGVVLQVTESRVCQILGEATLKLRAFLKGEHHG